MTNSYGPGVSRVLDPTATQYADVILQQGKPPCDAEFTLLQDMANGWWRQVVMRGTPSGFLCNETNPRQDYVTSPNWSNWFKFGTQRSGEQSPIMWAVVNGWLIPVTGTRTGTPPSSPDNTDTYNVIALDPPPSNAGDFRIDFVFLEVWEALIAPNPSTLNKPGAASIYKYGNVEGGMSFLADDLIDPAIGFETTKRTQLQYRIRVVDGLVGLTSNPDGFDPTVVKAQGSASTPTSYVFANMRSVLGDPGLWRAGDGTPNALGSVDGYSYAVPLCAIFRRNSIGWNGDPSQNLNGGFNRNPAAVDRTGILTFSTVTTLATDLSSTGTVATLVSSAGIPLPTSPATPVLIQIGDELMTYTAVTTGLPPQITGLSRGSNNTRPELHRAGSTVTIISGRPDGLFSDQIAHTDILDLRHAVNPNGFDYQALLKGNLDRLLRGQLRANWKRTGAGPQGPFCFYQDKITTGAVSLGVTKLDAFDGIRQIFSDAASIQKMECVVLANSIAVPAPISAPGWQLAISANHLVRSVTGQFTTNDVIQIPVAQLKTGLSAGDADQVRWVFDNVQNAVTIRVDGQSVPIYPDNNQNFSAGYNFVVTGSNPVGGGITSIVPSPSGAGGTAARYTALTADVAVIDTLTGMSQANVGQALVISGSLNPSNNGTFLITSFISSTSVTILNPGAVVPDLGPLTWTLANPAGQPVGGLCLITMSQPHHLQPGQIVRITGVTGSVGAQVNGFNYVGTIISSTQFILNISFSVLTYLGGGTVYGPNLTSNDDLLIYLGISFPTVVAASTSGPTQLYITLNAMYGPGRGLSRRPDSLHSISYLNPSTDLLVRPMGIPLSDQQAVATWLPLWQKYRPLAYKRNVPVTSEMYADLGSKSLVVAPFRRISMATQFVTLDGSIANPYTTKPVTSVGSTQGVTLTDPTVSFLVAGINPGDTLILTSGTQQGRYIVGSVLTNSLTIINGTLPTNPAVSYTVEHIVSLVAGTNGQVGGGTTFTDTTVNFVAAGVVAGDLLFVANPSFSAKFTILNVTPTVLTMERGTPYVTVGLTYVVAHSQGNMPLNASNGTTPKWTVTDPLGLFSGTTQSSAATKNIYVTLPRHLAPGWGAFYVPPLWTDVTPYAQGINFLSLTVTGSLFADSDRNYVPYANLSYSYAIFSTLNPGPPIVPAVYNTSFLSGGKPYAGMRKFTDTRGLNRQGLELPPFYGIARLFAVYEANNYFASGSAYNSVTRAPTGTGAVNLLRQNMGPNDGPTFWVEIDADGDSTFILNANALDLSRSPTPIASFSAGDFVIEASIFGFDRGSFDITREFRIVLTNPDGSNNMRKQANDPTNRYTVGGTGPNVGCHIAGPVCVLPGPAAQTDQVVINYSRTPYMGDAWGSQTNLVDISQEVGPLTSGNAYQFVSTHLVDPGSLTRPNQKLFEVLASVGFSTTMGTGRISGDPSTDGQNFRDVGFEDMKVYPPNSPVAPRPVVLAGDFVTDTTEIGTEYLGATERLPLGALFRDKDFRGGTFTVSSGAPLVYSDAAGVGALPGNLAVNHAIEQQEILLDTSTAASGAPSDLIAHVDGEENNYSLLVNFRVLRGGSVFTAGGAHPGGEVSVQRGNIQAPDGHTNVLNGQAYLVRNYTTVIGANEVSPGGELMLLVATTVQQLSDPAPHGGFVSIGTNGTGEGYSAADFYRIDGHPMVRDNVRLAVDPTTIALSRRST